MRWVSYAGLALLGGAWLLLTVWPEGRDDPGPGASSGAAGGWRRRCSGRAAAAGPVHGRGRAWPALVDGRCWTRPCTPTTASCTACGCCCWPRSRCCWRGRVQAGRRARAVGGRRRRPAVGLVSRLGRRARRHDLAELAVGAGGHGAPAGHDDVGRRAGRPGRRPAAPPGPGRAARRAARLLDGAFASVVVSPAIGHVRGLAGHRQPGRDSRAPPTGCSSWPRSCSSSRSSRWPTSRAAGPAPLPSPAARLRHGGRDEATETLETHDDVDPHTDTERLRRSVYVEVLVALVVLGLTAVLVAEPRGKEALAAQDREPVSASAPLGGGASVTVTSDPGTHGTSSSPSTSPARTRRR